ncbi:Organic cation transporter protein [Mizuhopecten yessoensis]|uniref:Organic cation transporter protein n=1 Tax=Mizuhopecten yessoensis TaxID=6573 RepID=A0A210QHM6_MIZYE|nr:Organic cation transporter protein [Mizuhopecten yessoensis]
MQFDAILKVVGEFGPYQKRIYFLLCLPVLCIAMYDVIGAYLMYTPIHRCAAVSAHNSSAFFAVNGDDTIRSLPNMSAEYQYGECHIKVSDNRSKGEDRNVTSHLCSSWTYDKSVFTSTLVSENNLVCAFTSTSTYMQVAMHCGSIVGSLLQGLISDRFGRKITFCGSTTLMMLVGVGSAFTTNIYIFTILRFLQTICSTFRLWAGILINYFYTAGMILLAGIGYGLRHWKYIQIACSAPSAIFLVYWWVIPESPRWLISQGKQEEARAIILTIAKSNHRDHSLTLKQLTDDEDEPVKQYRIWHLLSSRSMILCERFLIQEHDMTGVRRPRENLI